MSCRRSAQRTDAMIRFELGQEIRISTCCSLGTEKEDFVCFLRVLSISVLQKHSLRVNSGRQVAGGSRDYCTHHAYCIGKSHGVRVENETVTRAAW